MLFRDLEFTESEEDKEGKLPETENNGVIVQTSITDISAKEAREHEKRERERITTEKEKNSYRAFLSELQKSKAQEEEEEGIEE
jgi:hypothetical protein